MIKKKHEFGDFKRIVVLGLISKIPSLENRGAIDSLNWL